MAPWSKGRKASSGRLFCAPVVILRVGRIAAIAADCKSADFGLRQFESGPAHCMFACPRGLRCFPAKEVSGNAPVVRIHPQTLCSGSLMERTLV